MKGYKLLFATGAIGVAMAVLAFSAPAAAVEETGSGAASGSGLQGKLDDETGGAEYTYRNAWNHRNKNQARHGEMGEADEAKKGRGFLDENGDGINDLAPDHDGDGIPNGQDPDWVKNRRDGTGSQQGNRGGDSARSERSEHRGRKGNRAAR